VQEKNQTNKQKKQNKTKKTTFSVISKSSHMLCTALALLSASLHKTTLAFL